MANLIKQIEKNINKQIDKRKQTNKNRVKIGEVSKTSKKIKLGKLSY